MRTSCLASWQSPSSSVQCFHWDRLYSAMSVGIGATAITRVVAGRATVGGGSAVGSWFGIDVPLPPRRLELAWRSPRWIL